jgi:hypothetical protein
MGWSFVVKRSKVVAKLVLGIAGMVYNVEKPRRAKSVSKSVKDEGNRNGYLPPAIKHELVPWTGS